MAQAHAADLFGDTGLQPAGETLIDNVNRLERMAQTMLDEIGKFRQRVKANEPAKIAGLLVVDKTRTAHHICMQFFDAQHKLHVRDPETGAGLGYRFCGAKDGGIIKRLIDTYEQRIVQAAIEKYFERQDEYTRSRGYTIGGLLAQFPSLLASLNRSTSNGVTARTAHNAQHADEAAEMIERNYR